ncbi:hypothetical protein BpHYR1_024824 [Brachionus plicatilis]|uniref:Uncharacterized protein n=1 Tax=Brachionus plicatilis TaxID=10195 RepID=A0A3M7PQ16_BRAPC|nr:hypothetical protein BpHYR1_024824 [Brachionus plicatilis]
MSKYSKSHGIKLRLIFVLIPTLKYALNCYLLKIYVLLFLNSQYNWQSQMLCLIFFAFEVHNYEQTVSVGCLKIKWKFEQIRGLKKKLSITVLRGIRLHIKKFIYSWVV